jgi:hypothetical protein
MKLLKSVSIIGYIFFNYAACHIWWLSSLILLGIQRAIIYLVYILQKNKQILISSRNTRRHCCTWQLKIEKLMLILLDRCLKSWIISHYMSSVSIVVLFYLCYLTYSKTSLIISQTCFNWFASNIRSKMYFMLFLIQGSLFRIINVRKWENMVSNQKCQVQAKENFKPKETENKFMKVYFV